MDKEKIMDRIAKLLALSDSPFEEEAKNALAKAHVLMQRHSIEEWELGRQTGKKTEYVTGVLYAHNAISLRRKLIAGIIHRRYNVRVILLGRRNIEIVAFGTKDNVENAQYVFNFLSSTFPRLYNKYYKDNGLRKSQSLANNFNAGVASGFESVLIENEKKATEQMGTALMVIGKELQEAYRAQWPVTKVTSTKRHRYSGGNHAYSSGYVQGRKISVNPGVGTTDKTRLGK